MTGRALCISKATNSLVWVIDGKPQMRMDVRFGSQELPTREGSFSVGWKSRNHVSTIYHTKMPYAMFFSGGQAVHYSPDFAARGYNGASHGCVNVRNLAGIQSLFRPGAGRRQGDRLPLTCRLALSRILFRYPQLFWPLHTIHRSVGRPSVRGPTSLVLCHGQSAYGTSWSSSPG